MVAHALPSPTDDPRRWSDRPAAITNGQLLAIQQTCEHIAEELDDLKREMHDTRTRVRSLETCNDNFDITLTQHDDRLDQLEAALAPVDSPAPAPVTPAPVRTLVAQPIGPWDHELGEFQAALETVAAGLLHYRRLGVPHEELPKLVRIAALMADARLTAERADDAAEDGAAEAWLAEGRAS